METEIASKLEFTEKKWYSSPFVPSCFESPVQNDGGHRIQGAAQWSPGVALSAVAFTESGLFCYKHCDPAAYTDSAVNSLKIQW